MAIRQAPWLLLFVAVVMAASSCASALHLPGFGGLHGRKYLSKSRHTSTEPRILAEKIDPEPPHTYSARILARHLQVRKRISDAAGVDIHSDYTPAGPHRPIIDPSVPPPGMLNFNTGNAHTDHAHVETRAPVGYDSPPLAMMEFNLWDSETGDVHPDYDQAGPNRPVHGHDYPVPPGM